jgi:hypothetical protein
VHPKTRMYEFTRVAGSWSSIAANVKTPIQRVPLVSGTHSHWQKIRNNSDGSATCHSSVTAQEELSEDATLLECLERHSHCSMVIVVFWTKDGDGT